MRLGYECMWFYLTVHVHVCEVVCQCVVLLSTGMGFAIQ